MPRDNPKLTRYEEYRYKYLSTIVTLTVVWAYSAVIVGRSFGLTKPLPGGTWATFTTAFFVAVAYSVGIDVFKQVSEIRANGGSNEGTD